MSLIHQRSKPGSGQKFVQPKAFRDPDLQNKCSNFFQKQRQKQIVQQNIKIVDRVKKIHTSNQSKIHHPVAVKSMNILKRQQQILKRSSQNDQLLKILRNAQPTYTQTTFRQHQQNQNKYKQLNSKFNKKKDPLIQSFSRKSLNMSSRLSQHYRSPALSGDFNSPLTRFNSNSKLQYRLMHSRTPTPPKTSSQLHQSRVHASIKFHTGSSSRPHTPPRTPPSQSRPTFQRKKVQPSHQNLNFQRSQVNGKNSSDARKVQLRKSSLGSFNNKFVPSSSSRTLNQTDIAYQQEKQKLKVSAISRYYEHRHSSKNLGEKQSDERDQFHSQNEASTHRGLVPRKKSYNQYQIIQDEQSGYRPSQSNTPMSYNQSMDQFNHQSYRVPSRQKNERPKTPNPGFNVTKPKFKNLNKKHQYSQQQSSRTYNQQYQKASKRLTEHEKMQKIQQRNGHSSVMVLPQYNMITQSSSLQNTSQQQKPNLPPRYQINYQNRNNFTQPPEQLMEEEKSSKSARLQHYQPDRSHPNNKVLVNQRRSLQDQKNHFYRTKFSVPRNIPQNSQILQTMPNEFNATISNEQIECQRNLNQQAEIMKSLARPSQQYVKRDSQKRGPISSIHQQSISQPNISSQRNSKSAIQLQQQNLRGKIAAKNKQKMKFNLDKIDFSDLDSAFIALKSFVDHCKDASDRYTSTSQIDLKSSFRIQTAGAQELRTTNGFMELSQMQQPKELTPSQIMTNSQFQEKKTWENVEQKYYLTQQGQFIPNRY